jgi:hypothetical protein
MICGLFFYVFLTVHLNIILANDQSPSKLRHQKVENMLCQKVVYFIKLCNAHM